MKAKRLGEMLKELRDYAVSYNCEINRARFMGTLDKLEEEFSKVEKYISENKSIEREVASLDKELDENFKFLYEVYTSAKKYTPEEHIAEFDKAVAELKETSKSLNEIINVKQPEFTKIFLEEEIEEKSELLPQWRQVKKMYRYESSIDIGKIEEETSNDEFQKPEYSAEYLEEYDRRYKEGMRRREEEEREERKLINRIKRILGIRKKSSKKR